MSVEGETYDGVSNKETGIYIKLNPPPVVDDEEDDKKPRFGLSKLKTPKPKKIHPLPNGSHNMNSLDSVAIITSAQGTINYAIVCLVTGSIMLNGEKNALNFSQAFTIVVDGETPYCSNDIFRFNYA